MAFQIKSFVGSPLELQEQINNWLREKEIEVISVFSTVNMKYVTPNGHNEWMGTYITVVYREGY